MKRFVSLFVVIVLVLSMVPVSGFAAGVRTVYWDPVSGNDTNDGLKQEAPIKTMEAAYAALAGADEGVLVLLDTLKLTALTNFPTCGIPVTITSKTGAEGISSSANVNFNGETMLEMLTLTLTKASTSVVIGGGGHKFTIGKDVTCVPFVNTTDDYYFCLQGGLAGAGVASTDVTVQSGTWRNIYFGSMNRVVSGDAKLTMTGGTAAAVAPSYSSSVNGNVAATIGGTARITGYLYAGSWTKGDVGGNVDMTLTGNAYIYRLFCAGNGTGNVVGTVTVNWDGMEESIYNFKGIGNTSHTGIIGGSRLVLKSGVLAKAPTGFDDIDIEIPQGKNLTLKTAVTADNVTGAGTLYFSGSAKLSAASVTGTVNCAIEGERFNNHPYITAPAGSGFVFENNEIPEVNGTWIKKNLENFQGLVLTAEEGVSVTLYTGFDPDSSSVKKVEPYAVEGNTKYYPALLGNYYYRASGTGYYKVKKNIYMSPEKAMTKTVIDATPGKKSGLGWEPDNETVKYYTDEFIANAAPSDPELWPEFADLFTTPAFGEDRAEHQHTTQAEMESFIAGLDDANDNMYVYSMGTSGRGQNMPLVIFTRLDLTGKTLEEAAAMIVADSKASGKLTIHHQAHIHGNEQAAGEAALGLIRRLDGAYGERMLDSMNIYVMPRQNPDGAEDNLRRIPTWGLKDPNTDFAQLETKEVQNIVRMMNLFKPHVVIDNHEGNVAVDNDPIYHGYMLTNARYSTRNSEAFQNLGQTMVLDAHNTLRERDFDVRYIDNIVNGKGIGTILGYAGNQGILAFLIESPGILHGCNNYERRVVGAMICITTYYDYLNENLEEVKAIITAEQQKICDAGKTFEESDLLPLELEKTQHEEYAYQTPYYNAATGEVKKMRTLIPSVWDTVVRSRPAPTAYVIPAGEDWVADVLTIMDRHGILYTKLPAGSTVMLRQYTGSREAAQLTDETAVTFENGAYVFTMNTQKAEILTNLLEPDMVNTARTLTSGNGHYTSTSGETHTYIAAVDGVFPIYRYEHDLNAQGGIDGTMLPSAPEGLEATKITVIGGTGKITGLDATKVYEYRPEAAADYIAVAAGATEITGLPVGKYYIRYAATADSPASANAVLVLAYGQLDQYKVYLDSTNGTAENDGYTEETAVNTIDLAYSQLTKLLVSAPEGTTGVLEIIGTYMQDEERILPTHDYPLLITGGKLVFKELSPANSYAYLGMGGDTTFDNITLSLGTESDTHFLYAMGHKFVVGEGVVCEPFVSSTGSIHFFNISGGKKGGGTVTNTDITIKGGRFTTVYVADYTGKVTGSARAVLTDCRAYRVIPSYSGNTQCDVYIELRNMTIGKEVCCGHRSKNDVSGNVTLVLGENVTAPEDSIYAGSRNGGNINGTVTVIADGIDLTANAIHGKALNTAGMIGGLRLILNQGELADVADTFVTRDGVDIVLGCNQTKTVELFYNCNLDLNGYDVDVKVSDGKILSVKDSQTDDYNVLDNAYGKLTAIGSVKPIDGYLQIAQEDGISFPKYELEITRVSLRPRAAGIYFTGNFQIDASFVKRKGIAVSLVNRQPVADGTDETCLWTTGNTSALVANILSADKNVADNAQNGAMPIYARAYMELKDGTIIYSDAIDVDLLTVVQLIDSQWNDLNEVQKTAIQTMYTKFKETMDRWQIPNLKNAQ